jgi:HK97 family phage prohead protease
MRLNFTSSITASDQKTRTIIGQIVPFGVPGNTSLGPVIFEAGSIDIPDNVKVLLEHDNRRPVGKLVQFAANPAGIIAELKIAETTAGNDLLVEAAEGLRDGISVGANIIEHTIKNGQIVVSAAELVEISLVTNPAFDAARVTQVAASEVEPEPSETVEETEMTEQPIEVIEEVESVEASKVEASAVHSPIMTAPRQMPSVTAGEFAHKLVLAKRGNRDAQAFVTAAGEATTTDNEGLIPVPYLREVIGVVDARRPFIDSIERRQLPAAGMSFKLPRWVTQPSVAETAELAAPSDTMTEIDSLDVSIVKFAGQQRVSVELLERSDPAYLDELLRALAAKYAQATDAYAYNEAISGAGTSNGADLYTAIAEGIADSGSVMRMDPDRFLADSGNFAEILKATDGSGRPLFAAINPSNAAGQVSGSRGNVAGLPLYVDYNVNTGTGVEGVVYNSMGAAFYESGTAQVRVNVIDTMTVEIAVYGFVALANKYPTAFRNITVGA